MKKLLCSRISFFTNAGKEKWHFDISWPPSRASQQNSSLSWQEQPEKMLLLDSANRLLLLARHWTRTTGKRSNRHERYELHLLGMEGRRVPMEQQVRGAWVLLCVVGIYSSTVRTLQS